MQRQTLDWQFWGSWAAAFLGFPLGGLAGQAVTGGVTTVLDGLVGGAATGAVIGGIQWLVLRRRAALPVWWAAATGAGMGLGLALGVALFGTATDDNTLLYRGLLTGAAIAIAQYPLLRGWNQLSWLWLLAVGLGWPLGWLITRSVGVDLGPNWTVFGSTGAWMFQLLTGLVLARILPRRSPYAL
jgi:hypothetical protein